MLWELLVTEGHVRAARLRRVQPTLIALGLILVWLGFLLAKAGPQVAPGTSAPQAMMERLQKLQQRASRAGANLQQPQLSPAEIDGVPPARELQEVASTIDAALDKDGDLPEDEIDFEEVEVDEFWAGKWPIAKIAYVQSGDTLLLGGIVQQRWGGGVRLSRWVGVAHEAPKGGWDVHTLYVNGGENVAGREAIRPEQIALSLEDLTPELPEAPEQEGAQ